MKWFGVSLGLVLLVGNAAWGFDISDLSVDRSTRVTVSPATPTPEDDVSVTVSRWVQGGWGPVSSTVQTQGSLIRVNVHWEEIYIVAAVWPTPSHREEYTVSIGKLNPGNYSLIVTNDGKDTAMASFSVTGGDASNPVSTGWSFLDQLLGHHDESSSNGESVIDQVRKKQDSMLPYPNITLF
jgi:hypothetical protein